MKPTSTEPIVVSQTIAAPIDRVWKAITDRDRMVRWFFREIAAFRPEVGFETRFTVKVEERSFVHFWKVTEVSSPRRISYGWRYEGYPGDSTVTWELSEVDGGTEVTLIHDGIHTFPQDSPEMTRESGTAGWRYFVQDSLKKYLER